MSIIAWITLGLLPGFLAGALAAHFRETVRVSCSYSDEERGFRRYDVKQLGLLSGRTQPLLGVYDEYLRG